MMLMLTQLTKAFKKKCLGTFASSSTLVLLHGYKTFNGTRHSQLECRRAHTLGQLSLIILMRVALVGQMGYLRNLWTQVLEHDDNRGRISGHIKHVRRRRDEGATEAEAHDDLQAVPGSGAKWKLVCLH
jgi:hypothetical protein